MFLLDTNVVSGLRRRSARAADRRFVEWASAIDPFATFVSVVTLMEIEQGILLLARRDKPQAEILRRWFAEGILPSFAERTLSVDTSVALCAAALHVPDPKPDRDCLIAATGLVHGMTVVTRNVRHFVPTGVRVLDPWQR